MSGKASQKKYHLIQVNLYGKQESVEKREKQFSRQSEKHAQKECKQELGSFKKLQA